MHAPEIDDDPGSIIRMHQLLPCVLFASHHAGMGV